MTERLTHQQATIPATVHRILFTHNDSCLAKPTPSPSALARCKAADARFRNYRWEPHALTIVGFDQLPTCERYRKVYAGERWVICSRTDCVAMTCPHREADYKPGVAVEYTGGVVEGANWSRDQRTQAVITAALEAVTALSAAPGIVGAAARGYTTGDWTEAERLAKSRTDAQGKLCRAVASELGRRKA